MTRKTFKAFVTRCKKIITNNKYSFFIGLGSFFLITTFVIFARNRISSSEWKTIEDIRRSIDFLEENPKMENENIIKPDYATYFKQWERGFLNSLKEFVGLKKRMPWGDRQFIPLLKRVTEQRKGLGFEDDMIVKVQLQEGNRLIVIGNLQGAFHSLVRDLEELVKMNILSKELKLINKTDFLFCTGDAINRSPYSIETMGVLMRLLEENPEQFFYIQGNHEDNNYWKDYTLKQELKAKIGGGSGDSIPLEGEINTFFETLPIAWYGELYPAGSKKFLRISHEGLDYPKLQEAQFKNFLMSAYENPLSKHKVSVQNTVFTGEPSPLVGIIRAEKKRKTYQTMDGIRMLPPEEGIVSWTVLSCPTKVYQLGIKFFYDAFAIVECKGQLADWTITLYNQDIRIKNGFSARVHNFISGSVIGGPQQNPEQAIQQVVQQQQNVQQAPVENTVQQVSQEQQVATQQQLPAPVQTQQAQQPQPPQTSQQTAPQQSQPSSQPVVSNQSQSVQPATSNVQQQLPQSQGQQNPMQPTTQNNQQPVSNPVVPAQAEQVVQQQQNVQQAPVENTVQQVSQEQQVVTQQQPSAPVQTQSLQASQQTASQQSQPSSQPVTSNQLQSVQPVTSNVQQQLPQSQGQQNPVQPNVQTPAPQSTTIQNQQQVQQVVNLEDVAMVKKTGEHQDEIDDDLKNIELKKKKKDDDEEEEDEPVIIENPEVVVSREQTPVAQKAPIADALPVNPAEATVTANMSN